MSTVPVTFSMTPKQRKEVSLAMASMQQTQHWRVITLSAALRSLIADGIKYREQQKDG